MGENDRVSERQQSRLRDGKCCRFRGGAGMSGRKSGVNGRTGMGGMMYNNIKVILYE